MVPCAIVMLATMMSACGNDLASEPDRELLPPLPAVQWVTSSESGMPITSAVSVASTTSAGIGVTSKAETTGIEPGSSAAEEVSSEVESGDPSVSPWDDTESSSEGEEASEGSVDPTVCTDEMMAEMFGCTLRGSYEHGGECKGGTLCADPCSFESCEEDCNRDLVASHLACYAKYPLCAALVEDSWQECSLTCPKELRACQMRLSCAGNQDPDKIQKCVQDMLQCNRDC